MEQLISGRFSFQQNRVNVSCAYLFKYLKEQSETKNEVKHKERSEKNEVKQDGEAEEDAQVRGEADDFQE